MGLSDDTPPGFREPSPMATALEVARLGERLKAVVQRMESRDAHQDERDEDFRESMRAVVLEAVASAVAPLDARIKTLEKMRNQLLAVGAAASVVAPVVWTFVERMLFAK